MNVGDLWETYELANGERIYGDYSFMTEVDAFEEMDSDKPFGVLRKTWQLVAVETLTFGVRPTGDEEE